MQQVAKDADIYGGASKWRDEEVPSTSTLPGFEWPPNRSRGRLTPKNRPRHPYVVLGPPIFKGNFQIRQKEASASLATNNINFKILYMYVLWWRMIVLTWEKEKGKTKRLVRAKTGTSKQTLLCPSRSFLLYPLLSSGVWVSELVSQSEWVSEWVVPACLSKWCLGQALFFFSPSFLF